MTSEPIAASGKLDLLRIEKTPIATRGLLMMNGKIICLTLELPWRKNEQQVSCIPEGEYVSTWEAHPQWKECQVARLAKVPGRSGILIHPANYVSELRGCIALGLSLLPGTGIGSSVSAMTLLRKLLDEPRFVLRIRSV